MSNLAAVVALMMTAAACGACVEGDEDAPVTTATIPASDFHGGIYSIQWVPGTTVTEASVTVAGDAPTTMCAQLGGGKWCTKDDRDGKRVVTVKFRQVVGDVDPLHIVVAGNNSIVAAQVLVLAPADDL